VISLFAPISWLPVPILNLQGPMTLLALVAVAVVGWVLYATPVGLAMRMVGENPRAVERQGLRVAGIRWGALVAGSALMGVGGACFTLAAYGGTGAFDAGLVDGRGWICMALAVFASWKPGRAALATLLFAALDAWQLAMQPPPAMGLGAPLLAQLVRMLPYVLAIAALVVVARRTSYPQAWMKPYRKGER
jgi:simple sugar transport system permease protein